MTRRLIALTVLLTVSAAASAEVWRWVDSQGRVHYSDVPIEGATRVEGVNSRTTNREVVAQRTANESEQRAQLATRETQQRTEQATSEAVQQDVGRAREEQCKKAQEQYKTAVESQRLYRVGKDGERVYLTDAELTEARVNSRKAVDELCKPAG
jgi:Domain of unknown function (DUF4124)